MYPFWAKNPALFCQHGLQEFPLASQQMSSLLFFSFEMELTWQAQPKCFLSVHIQISIDRCQNNLPVMLILLFANLE